LHELELHTAAGKEETYSSLLPQIHALCHGESNLTANLANISAALKQAFNWWWTGFYIVNGNELIVGPFQGTVACTRIGLGKGVCGTSWQRKETILVDDVEQFPGHIACSSLSRSEIVVPIIKNNEVVAVLDVDSERLAHFDQTDKRYLEELARFISTLF
jgi:L-methionine (R)-S-oxide reductase